MLRHSIRVLGLIVLSCIFLMFVPEFVIAEEDGFTVFIHSETEVLDSVEDKALYNTKKAVMDHKFKIGIDIIDPNIAEVKCVALLHEIEEVNKDSIYSGNYNFILDTTPNFKFDIVVFVAIDANGEFVQAKEVLITPGINMFVEYEWLN